VDTSPVVHRLPPSAVRAVGGCGRQWDGGSPLTWANARFPTIHSTYYGC
jgi:hypothetical protein